VRLISRSHGLELNLSRFRGLRFGEIRPLTLFAAPQADLPTEEKTRMKAGICIPASRARVEKDIAD
jgi:hypothetical protein